MLHWTGHTLVDNGLAVITAWAGKSSPEEVTDADLEDFCAETADWVKSKYVAAHLTVLFTTNNPATHPSMKPDKKARLFEEWIYAWRDAEPLDQRCVYCGRPAVQLGFRDTIPLLTGRETVNFFPYGEVGLAVCGHCLLAMVALSVGVPFCEGKSLIIESAHPDVLLGVIDGWNGDLMEAIQLSLQINDKVKLSRPLTWTIDALVRLYSRKEHLPARAIRLLHLSNSGQGPDIRMIYLESPVVRFARRAQGARYAPAWNALVQASWRLTPDDPAIRPWRTANSFYEDLFSLPDQAARFLRRYFLNFQWSQLQGTRRLETNLWPLAALFLEEVLEMDKGRIESIETLGNRLAEHVMERNDARLLQRLYQAENYREVRNLLIKASFARVGKAQAPVLGFREFLTLFEEGEELARADWRLAWDLVVLRLLERLHESGWFKANADAIAEDSLIDGEEETA